MRIAYFDCFSGISGDMTLGAFLDAGLSFDLLSKELSKLKLTGYELKRSRVKRQEISCTKFDCIIKSSAHSHRSLKEINLLIDKSSLNSNIKELSKKIFANLGRAETKAHGNSRKSDVVLHELGDIDSIIDIVGTAIAVDALKIDEVYASGISLGRTMVDTRHGRIPATSPAAAELLKGVPVTISEVDAELVTPTGAAILKTLVKRFAHMPQAEISSIGYGAGSKILADRPNMLRIIMGERVNSFKEDTAYVIETNIDDMSPQHIGFVFEKLMEAGALDVYVTNIQMKKSRPAFKLTVIASSSKLQELATAIFKETTAIGLRFYEVNRLKLDRDFKRVKTSYGELNVKTSKGPGDLFTASPEYEECAALARRKNVPLRKIYDAAKRAALILVFFLLAPGPWPLAPAISHADTIYTNEGQEIRGIIVEDYKDRITLSTVNGEISIMKSDIKELYFDEEVDNLIKLAEQAKEKKDYIKALTYYDLAFRKNPNSKAAKDGLVFLEGYLFRKEQAQKEADVKRREELESFGATVSTVKPEAEEISQKAGRLKKALGITIEVKDGSPQIMSVKRNSPADEAGILKGDRIVAIWARLTGYMDMREVMDAMLDKPSLELKCTLERTVDLETSMFRMVVPASHLVGASFKMELQGLTVSSVKDGSAAAVAGLKAGDHVTAINGKPTRYMPLKKAISMIRHSKDGTVKLTIRRETLIWRRD